MGNGIKANVETIMTCATPFNTVCTCTRMCDNRRNKARIHVHFSLCRESDLFMGFTLIIKYLWFYVSILTSWTYFYLLKAHSYWSWWVYPSHVKIRGFQLCELDWRVWVVGFGLGFVFFVVVVVCFVLFFLNFRWCFQKQRRILHLFECHSAAGKECNSLWECS